MATTPPDPAREIARPRVQDCQHMIALGLSVEDGEVRMAGTRDQVRAAAIEAMAGCRELFQSDGPMEDANGDPTPLLIARRRHLGLPDAPASVFTTEWLRENDPMRRALDEAHRLFGVMARAIFEPDPPSQGERNLPPTTFEGVPYFFDLAELASESGYDVAGVIQLVEGESTERAHELNRRAWAGSGAADAQGGHEARPEPPQHPESALADIRSDLGASP